MRLIPSILSKNLKYLLPALLLAGCTTEKETGFNRAMQNLTTKYNILFNAEDILRQKQESVASTYIDNYGQILSVYPDTAARPSTPDKLLESVIVRGNTIISEKTQSHYIGDAYFLLGRANFMEYNYFNAIEFFSYVIRSFPKNKNLVQESRVWKARSLMHINQLALADTALDTALHSTFPKEKNIADVFAAKLQYDIYTEKYVDAEVMATQAIHYSGDIDHRLRWTFILAQVQEINHKPTEAVKNYTRVANSNASFEMAFNASLNRVRVEEDQSGNKMTRIEHLRRLLKEDKNKEFIDQIYYQIGEQYFAQGNLEEAIKNYKLSIRSSLKNQNQKGMSYLRLADINFKNKADYPNAKKYYDSTLTNLSPNYPGYQIIRKKSDNLQLLVDRLQTISREDTLQMLAILNEKDRAAKINQLVKRGLAQQQAAAAAATKTAPQPVATTGGGVGSTSSFYFYNSAAMGQGYNDFKRIWGNRPLTDNWRRSSQAVDNSTTVNPTVTNVAKQANQTAPNALLLPTPTDPAAAKLQADLVGNIPLTPAQLTLSNNRVYGAYLDIANFYRDILGDNKEAITIFELMLKRFPNNINKPTLYYNLYRLYSDIDPKQSDVYKDLILKNYPESDFARVILDPDYNQKLNDKNAAFTASYVQLFDLVAHRKYTEAVTRADELIALFPGNSFLAQVYYLRLIAMGHQQKLDPFKLELQEILDKFPDDRLIVPLVKQHLTFIAANEDEIAAREVVLTDTDPTEVPFMQKPQVTQPYVAANFVTQQPIAPQAKQTAPVIKPPVTAPATTTTTTTTQPVNLPPANNAPVTTPATPPVVVEAPSIFSLRDSSNYYFVVNINTNKINPASSRFGIGQFNRANYNNNTIKHQLKPVGENQLIYVGRFSNLAAVKAYARAIVPLLPEIMNIAADKYTFFIITQENLDKLADKKTLDSYFDYYQKHY